MCCRVLRKCGVCGGDGAVRRAVWGEGVRALVLDGHGTGRVGDGTTEKCYAAGAATRGDQLPAHQRDAPTPQRW